MVNRFGALDGDHSERIELAATTIGCCEAMVLLHVQCGDCSTREFDALARIEARAIMVFHELGVALPDEVGDSDWLAGN